MHARTDRRSRAGPCARRGGSSRSPLGGAGQRDDDALARLPRLARCRAARGTRRAPPRPGPRPKQRELAQRAEVARRGSSCRARRRCARPGRCCRGPCAGGSPRASCRRARSGRRARTISSGIVSRCLTPVILLDDVVQRLEVLDVERRDRRRCPARAAPRRPASASRCASPGTLVCASSSTSATSGVRARTASTSISSNVAPRYSTRLPRHDLEVADLRGGRAGGRASRRSRRRRRCPRSRRRRPSFEHREGLADARRGAEVDAERAASHARRARPSSAVEGEVQLEHVDARLAEEPERAAVRVLVDQREHLVERQAARRGDARRLQRGRSRRRCAGRGRSPRR